MQYARIRTSFADRKRKRRGKRRGRERERGDGQIMKPAHLAHDEKSLAQTSDAEPISGPDASGRILWNKAEALERLGGDEDLFRELCQIFLEESPKLVQKLREAISDCDPKAVMRAAHSLKGELGYWVRRRRCKPPTNSKTWDMRIICLGRQRRSPS